MTIQKLDPHEVARQASLALVLEPIAEKAGCTTRSIDLSNDLKLIYFLANGVNSNEYFYTLAKRVNRAGGQPKVFFDLFVPALKNTGKYNQSTKFINYGLIEIMLLVVTAQVSYTRGSISDKMLTTLKKSSVKDVWSLEMARSLAWSTSTKDHKRNYPKHIGGKNLFEHYKLTRDYGNTIDHTTGVFWCEELIAGAPTISKMVTTAEAALDKGFIHALELGYEVGMKTYANAGLMADYTAATAYLLLAQNPLTRIVG